MIGLFKLIWSHKWAIILLTVMVLLSGFLIHRWKAGHPGSMTVIESQAMDMSVMKPPEGAVPVAVERVGTASLSPQVHYVGSVAALEEQQVFSRTEGYLKTLSVYDGDSVSTGQILATIDSPELASRVNESKRVRETASSEVPVAEAGLDKMSADKQAAEADVDAAIAEVERTQAMLEGAKNIVQQRESDVAAAKANVEYWRAEIAREEKLLQSGAVSLQEYQSEKADAAKMEAELGQRNGMLAEAKQNVSAAAADVKSKEKMVSAARKRVLSSSAGVAQAKAEIRQKYTAVTQMHSMEQTAKVLESFRNVKSSISGVVTRRYVSPGQYVNSSTPILGIASLDKVRLQAKISETDAGSVRVGTRIHATFTNHPDLAMDARITSISPSADQTSRSLLAEAIIPNPGRKLLPGESVDMTINLESHMQGLSVPSSAIILRSDSSYVWTVRKSVAKGKQEYYCTMHPQIVEDHPGKCPICFMALVPRTSNGSETAHLVLVTTGGNTGDRTLITSGLSPEDEIIFQGQTYLEEGNAIFRTKWSSDGPTDLPAAAGSGDMSGMDMGPYVKTVPSTPKPADSPSQDKPTVTVTKQPAKIKTYVCPMHPEVTSHDPNAVCPKCGMKLVEKH